MSTTESSKKRVRVPRKLGPDGQPLPHRHEHKSRVMKHSNGRIAPTTEYSETSNASEVFPATTYDVNSTISSVSITKTNDKQAKRDKKEHSRVKKWRRAHVDPLSVLPNNKPLHIFENLKDLETIDSSRGDPFRDLEKDKKFDPTMRKSKFMGHGIADTTTYSGSELESVDPDITTITYSDVEGGPRTSQSFTSFMGPSTTATTIPTTTTEPSVIPIEKGEMTLKKKMKLDPFNPPKNGIDCSQLYPPREENDLYSQFLAGKAVTLISDIVWDEPQEPEPDLKPEPEPEPQIEADTEFTSTYIEVSDTSADFARVPINGSDEAPPSGAFKVEPAPGSYYAEFVKAGGASYTAVANNQNDNSVNLTNNDLTTVEEFVSATIGSAQFVEAGSETGAMTFVEVTATETDDDRAPTIHLVGKEEFDQQSVRRFAEDGNSGSSREMPQSPIGNQSQFNIEAGDSLASVSSAFRGNNDNDSQMMSEYEEEEEEEEEDSSDQL